jgi:hypothetical protein
VPLLTYDLNLDQFADSTSYKWTLYPPGTIIAGTPPAPAPGSTPVDLTSATGARMMIRNHPGDPAPLVSLTTTLSAMGKLTLGGVLGTIALNITAAATALLRGQSPGALTSQYRYQIFVDFADGTHLEPVGGRVITTLAVTY